MLPGPPPGHAVFAEEFVLPVPEVTADQVAASAPNALSARLAVRDAMMPHLGEGWRVVSVDRQLRTYTLAR